MVNWNKVYNQHGKVIGKFSRQYLAKPYCLKCGYEYDASSFSALEDAIAFIQDGEWLCYKCFEYERSEDEKNSETNKNNDRDSKSKASKGS